MLFNILGWLLLLVWVGSFLFGTYCALQVWLHRLPARHRHKSLFPITDHLDPEGRLFLKKALQAWGVAVGVILLATVVL